MIPLGLSAAEKGALEDTLTGTHSVHVTVQVLDLEGHHIGDPVTDKLLSGQVNIDYAGAVTRSCTLSLLDPRRSLHFDSESPTDGALYVDRMVKVVYSVKAPRGNDWFDIPVFCGPISSMDRTNDVVNIEAQGKEILAQGAAWKTKVYKKGHYRVDVIKSILRDLAGETKFTFPEHSAKLPHDLSVGRESIPWHVARKIAKGMNMQLFYDGRGVARLRHHPASSQFTFKSGDGGSVLTPPQITYSTENLKNIVWVRGKGKVSVSRAAPHSHPLSPQKLGRNGVPRYLLDSVQDTTIRTRAEAVDVAKTRLNDALLSAIDVSFDAMSIPHLEPGDMVRVTTDDFSNAFRIHQMSIPLVVGGNMSVGYLANRSPHKRKIRR
jgi:hypothetical protein